MCLKLPKKVKNIRVLKKRRKGTEEKQKKEKEKEKRKRELLRGKNIWTIKINVEI